MKYLLRIGLVLSLPGIGMVVLQFGAYAVDLEHFRPSFLLAVPPTVLAESDLLLAIVPNRAITAGGDTLFYLFAAVLGKRQQVPRRTLTATHSGGRSSLGEWWWRRASWVRKCAENQYCRSADNRASAYSPPWRTPSSMSLKSSSRTSWSSLCSA